MRTMPAAVANHWTTMTERGRTRGAHSRERAAQMIAIHGLDLIPTDHVPRGVRGATLEAWKEGLSKAALINRKGNDREQFRRIRVTLQDAGMIGVWEEFVWPSHSITCDALAPSRHTTL